MSTTDNINGIYAKDTELRNGISELRGDILSQTIKPLSVTKNGTYTSDPSAGAYGYSPITVDVQEEPWEPLQDGYSNFWFELTNDTLSPWLNFSAKTESAVIDWGDGSGEQSLTTLTPTHTYSKPGRYVVKCKGVTGIAQQHNYDVYSEYRNSLTAIELNSEITSISQGGISACNNLVALDARYIASVNGYSIQYCGNLRNVRLDNATSVLNGVFRACVALHQITINNIQNLGEQAFYYCGALSEITLPSSISSIGAGCFNNCFSLSAIHCQATTPPTLGANAFGSLSTNYIIYVPVGYGETYKAASGWSTYADHILEEGQIPNRAMLAKFNSTNTDNEEMR